MTEKADSTSLVDYYRRNSFNPVPISVEDHEVWNEHFTKRRNLYERHLGIPLSFLSDRSIVEFGPNSGENALVLAMSGGNLTLVEPNEQVLPRLRDLFGRFGLTERIKEIRQKGVDTFEATTQYDLAVAEGFLYTLPNRDAMLGKIADLLNPGGIGIISFNDRYGGLIEFTKKMVLRRACELASIETNGDSSLDMARDLFGDDFARLGASRPFEAWWKDTLVNPFVSSQFLWSYDEILQTIEKHECVLYSTSPVWTSFKNYKWYKDTTSFNEIHKEFMLDWRRAFPYFLTGIAPAGREVPPASDEVVESVKKLVDLMSAYSVSSVNDEIRLENIRYPEEMRSYLAGVGDQDIEQFNDDMQGIFQIAQGTSFQDLVRAYRNSSILGGLWGTAYHYVTFIKR
jgi:SAM-dependent methyltransferase